MKKVTMTKEDRLQGPTMARDYLLEVTIPEGATFRIFIPFEHEYYSDEEPLSLERDEPYGINFVTQGHYS